MILQQFDSTDENSLRTNSFQFHEIKLGKYTMKDVSHLDPRRSPIHLTSCHLNYSKLFYCLVFFHRIEYAFQIHNSPNTETFSHKFIFRCYILIEKVLPLEVSCAGIIFTWFLNQEHNVKTI